MIAPRGSSGPARTARTPGTVRAPPGTVVTALVSGQTASRAGATPLIGGVGPPGSDAAKFVDSGVASGSPASPVDGDASRSASALPVDGDASSLASAGVTSADSVLSAKVSVAGGSVVGFTVAGFCTGLPSERRLWRTL